MKNILTLMFFSFASGMVFAMWLNEPADTGYTAAQVNQMDQLIDSVTEKPKIKHHMTQAERNAAYEALFASKGE